MNKPILILCALVFCANLAHAQSYPNPRAVKDLPAAPAQGKESGDFKGGPGTRVELRGNALSIASTGDNASIVSGPLPAGIRGPYFLEFRFNSNAPQPMNIYWKTGFDRDWNDKNKLSVGKAGTNFDGKYRYYLMQLPESVVAPLTQLRIDPASGPGESLFEFIRLRSMTGKIYKEWKVGS